MEPIKTLQLQNSEENDSFTVEIDAVLPDESDAGEEREYSAEIEMLNKELEALFDKHAQLEQNIDFYTNHADKWDYAIAAASGLLTAVLDALLKEKRILKVLGPDIGDQNLLDYFNKLGSDTANKKIQEMAKKGKLSKAAEKSAQVGNSKVKTTTLKSDSLEGIIRFMEERFNLPSDSLTSAFGGSNQHHLRDFAHHPSIVGLICSLLTQFTLKCYGTDVHGKFITLDLNFVAGKEGRIAKAKKEVRIIGDTLPEKFIIGTTLWYYHLISDLAGSTTSPGAGMGIPGPLMSLAKELSALPIFRNKDGENDFSKLLSKLYNGTLLAEHDENGKIKRDANGNKMVRKIDFRTEIGMASELKKQAGPVLLNELIVRGFYFIRRLFMEIKEKNIRRFSDLQYLDANKVIPFRNRTIVRMMTISTGVFTATNLTIAAGIGAAKSAGNPALFAKEFVLRINFVGAGRFLIAVGADIGGGIRKTQLENEKFGVEAHIVALTNVKTFYYQTGTWVEMIKTEEAMQSLETTMLSAFKTSATLLSETKKDMESIEENIDVIKKDKKTRKQILDILEED